MSESEALFNSSVEADHNGHHQPPTVGDEMPLRRQLFTLSAVKSAIKQLTGIYTLLAFVPLGFAAGIFRWNAVLVSSLNFLAIIPLSAVISTASSKLEARLGSLIGVLINATFGNVVELIVSCAANSDCFCH